MLRILITAVLVLAIIYGIKKLCGVGLFEDFPENLTGIRWFLAKTNVFFAIVIALATTDFLLIPMLESFIA